VWVFWESGGYRMLDVRLLGIDVGTSGCKVLVIDGTGCVLAQAAEKYPISHPQPTWSEQNPEDWWQAVQKCLLAIKGELWKLDKNSEPTSQYSTLNTSLTAIGLTGQMHGAVFLDENDLIIRPAILWNDQRTTEECAEIERIIGADRVREITGNPPLTGFQLPKILWLRKHEPENFARVRKVLLPKDYIRFRLTGEYATEVSDASGTGIFDVKRRGWSTEMMAQLDLDRSLFPTCVESCDQTGFATPSIHHSLFMFHDSSPDDRSPMTDHRIPVFGGAGDQAAGAVGTGAVREGVTSISLGTSGVVFSSCDSAKVDPDGALHAFCHANGQWHLMGVMLSCGGALIWYGANIRHLSAEEVLAEAATATPGCGGLTFLPYLCGERSPHNDPEARASFSGLNLTHTSADMSRAVVEGVSFGLRQIFELLETRNSERGTRNGLSSNSALPAPSSEFVVTGGGARSEFWVQMIADVFGIPCSTLESDEGPAFGAALIAGVGAGVWKTLAEACEVCVRRKATYSPSEIDYSEAYNRYVQLYPHLKGRK